MIRTGERKGIVIPASSAAGMIVISSVALVKTSGVFLA